MIAEIKKGWKLLRYGYGLKINIVICVLLLILGILMLCIGEAGLMMGTLYILMTPTMLLQLASTLLFSGMAAASPRRKLLELYLPDLLSIITGVLGYIIVVGTSLFWVSSGRENVQDCIQTMLMSSALVAIMLIYFGAAYKYFVSSVILFTIGILFGISGGIITMRLVGEYLTLFSASLVCLGVMAAGILISCWLRRMFYKKQISPLAGGTSLRKAMQ